MTFMIKLLVLTLLMCVIATLVVSPADAQSNKSVIMRIEDKQGKLVHLLNWSTMDACLKARYKVALQFPSRDRTSMKFKCQEQ